MNASGAVLAAVLDAPSHMNGIVEMPPQPDPISAGLKKLFETVADEPIPDDFLSLLDRIDNERAARQAGVVEPKLSAGGGKPQ